MRRCRQKQQQKQQQQQNTVFPITLHTLPTMRDTFISKGILVYVIQLLPPRTKKYPPSAKQCWISYCTSDGLCSGTTLNCGEGL